MHKDENNLTGRFWIDDFKIDPEGLRLTGPSGEIALEPKVMQVLVTLASNAGEVVSRDVLMDTVWAVEYGSDESLTRVISVLRKSFGDAHGRRSVIETIPRMGYKLIGTVSREGPAAQPGTDKVEATGFRTPASKPALPVKWVLGLAAAFVVVLIGFFAQQNHTAPASNPSLKSVTIDHSTFMRGRVLVSTFETQSNDPDAKSLATSLVPQLSSVMSANGVLTTLDDKTDNAWQEFDLEGNVEVQAKNLRVTMRFIDHRTQLIVWSEVFERPRDQVKLFSEEVAAKTAAVIGCFFQWRSDLPNAKIETFPLYARFCEAYIFDKDAFFTQGYTALTGAIYDADPDNPKALSLHAWGLERKARYSNTITDTQKDALRTQSEDLMRAALAADPNGPFENYLLASLEQRSGNWAEIETLLLPAASRYGMPDFVYNEYGNLLRSVGRNKDAAILFENAVSANPADMFARTRLGWLYTALERPVEAKKQYAAVDRYDPDYNLLYIRRQQGDVYLGDRETARAYLENPSPADTQSLTQVDKCQKMYLRFKWFEPADSDALLAACETQTQEWKVRYLTGIGDVDGAFKIAEFSEWIIPSTMLLFYPDMAPFRADPRFWLFAQKVGLVNYWQETGKWPDFCDTDDLPVDCKVAVKQLRERRKHRSED